MNLVDATLNSLTADERAGLAADINLADAHTYQEMTTAEQEQILERFVDIFRSSRQRNYWELEKAAASAFGCSVGQSDISNLVVATYASSISTMIVARSLRRSGWAASLTVPTFDNVYALLAGEGVAIRPRQLDQSLVEWVKHQNCPKVLFEVTPNNPTGHFISETELRELAAACEAYGRVLVLDQSFKAHDHRACFDYYAVLEDAGAQYIVIEDTGKLWPIRDLKVSFIHASASLYNILRDVADDVLLNVAPFILGLTERYAQYSAEEHYENVRGVLRNNRRAVRAFAQRFESQLTVPYPDSNVSVEVLALRTAVGPIVADLAGRGLRVLDCAKFYWGGHDLQHDQVRVALARDPDVVQRGIAVFSEYLSERGGPRG